MSVKILITNIVSLNTGDAAILQGTIQILQKKYGNDVDIVVFDSMANVAQKFYPWASFRQSLFSKPKTGWHWGILERWGYGHWFNRLKFIRYRFSISLIKSYFSFFTCLLLSEQEKNDIMEYLSADIILSTGGTYLIENYDLSSAIYDYRLSLATGNKFGFFTQTLGPFIKEKNKSAFTKIFSLSDIILLRDEASKNNILDLGLKDKNIFLAADAAFVLEPEKEEPKHKKSNFKLAISVRSMKFFNEDSKDQNTIEYMDGIALAVTLAVDKYGAEVTFLSTCQGIESYWANDAAIATEIYNMLAPNIQNHVSIDAQFRQPAEIIEAYRSFDAVIATRMHAAILSICAGTPVLGLAYEFKMQELFKNIGLSQLVLKIQTFTKIEITDVLSDLMENTAAYKSEVKLASKKMNAQAWLVIDALPDI